MCSLPSGRRLPRLVAWSTLALAACQTYRAAPLDLDRAPQAFARRRLDAPELRTFVAAFVGRELPDWPNAPLRLDELQAIALRQRSELATARAALAEALAGERVAGLPPNPSLTIGPGIVTNPGDAKRWLLTAGALLPLDLAGRRSARERIAAAERAAAELAVAQADQAVRADVVERAFARAHAAALAELAAQAATVRAELAALAERRAAAGAADSLEVAAARAEAQRAAIASTAAATDAAAAGDALANALAMPPAALADRALRLPGDEDGATSGAHGLPILDAAAVAALTANAVRARLDVAAALAVYEHREAELALATAEQYPDLELGPGYEFDQGLHKFRLDFGVTLPLFHGNDAAIAQATAARTAAGEAVEAVQLQAMAEIAAAVRQLAAQPAALTAARELDAAAVAHVATVRRRCEAGADDAAALLAARGEAIVARSALVEQIHAARLAWLHCETALQQSIGEGLLAWQRTTPENRP